MFFWLRETLDMRDRLTNLGLWESLMMDDSILFLWECVACNLLQLLLTVIIDLIRILIIIEIGI